MQRVFDKQALEGKTFNIEGHHDDGGESLVSVIDRETSTRLIFPFGWLDENEVSRFLRRTIGYNDKLTDDEVDYLAWAMGGEAIVLNCMDYGDSLEDVAPDGFPIAKYFPLFAAYFRMRENVGAIAEDISREIPLASSKENIVKGFVSYMRKRGVKLNIKLVRCCVPPEALHTEHPGVSLEGFTKLDPTGKFDYVVGVCDARSEGPEVEREVVAHELGHILMFEDEKRLFPELGK